MEVSAYSRSTSDSWFSTWTYRAFASERGHDGGQLFAKLIPVCNTSYLLEKKVPPPPSEEVVLPFAA